MTNNDVLRRVRYVFDLSDSQMIAVFGLAEREVSRAEVCDWLKGEEDEAFVEIDDTLLATFLNGLIVDKRGRREGPQPIPETQLDNNGIFRKLKIALSLEADEILKILRSAGCTISRHELSALFRKPGHKHHRVCKDQILRYFIRGLRLQHRPGDSDGADDEVAAG